MKIELTENDFTSLVEARTILEINCVRLAAERRTTEDILELKNVLNAFEEKVNRGELAVEEDLIFPPRS